jgi:transposase
MINHVAKKILPLNLSSLKRLGIDEISLVKGQGKFIVVLVDLDPGKLVGLVKEKKKKSIEEVLLSWGTEILQLLHEELNQGRIEQKKQQKSYKLRREKRSLAA